MNVNISQLTVKSPVTRVSSRLKSSGSMFQLIVLVMVAVIFYWFIVGPKRQEIKEQRRQITSLQEKSAELSKQLATLDTLVKQLKRNGPEIAKLDESLPLHGRTTWLHLLTEQLVTSSGLTLGSLSVSNVEDDFIAGNRELMQNPFKAKRQVKKVSANLGVSGTVAQFEAFLKKLENNARIIDVKVLEISGAQDQLVDFKLTFDAYYFALPAVSDSDSAASSAADWTSVNK